MVSKARNLKMNANQELSITELNNKLRDLQQVARSYRAEIVRYAINLKMTLVKQSARDLLCKHAEIAAIQLALANAEIMAFDDADKI